MSRRKKIVKEVFTNVIDQETGEHLGTLETEITKVSTSDEFMQIYLEDMSGLLNIDNSSEFQVLAQLWKRSQFNTNEVVLVKAIKQDIAQIINTTLQNVNNTITKLKKKGLLISHQRGIYFLNPKFFFKGYIDQRPKALKVILNYEIQDITDEIEEPKKAEI